jgi:hypothetical protein
MSDESIDVCVSEFIARFQSRRAFENEPDFLGQLELSILVFHFELIQKLKPLADDSFILSNGLSPRRGMHSSHSIVPCEPSIILYWISYFDQFLATDLAREPHQFRSCWRDTVEIFQRAFSASSFVLNGFDKMTISRLVFEQQPSHR